MARLDPDKIAHCQREGWVIPRWRLPAAQLDPFAGRSQLEAGGWQDPHRGQLGAAAAVAAEEPGPQRQRFRGRAPAL